MGDRLHAEGVHAPAWVSMNSVPSLGQHTRATTRMGSRAWVKRAGIGRALVGHCQIRMRSCIESTGPYMCLILTGPMRAHQGAGHGP